MKLVACERFLNVHTSKQRGKNWQLVWPLGGGGPSLVQPAKWLIRHWVAASQPHTPVAVMLNASRKSPDVVLTVIKWYCVIALT